MEANSQEIIICPYCKKVLDKKPKRSKKCPFCKNRIAVYKGVLYQENELFHKIREERHQKAREFMQFIIRRDREFYESDEDEYFFEFRAAPDSCNFCANMSGKKIPYKEAIRNLNLLPPFESCQDVFCRCITEMTRKKDEPKSEKGG